MTLSYLFGGAPSVPALHQGHWVTRLPVSPTSQALLCPRCVCLPLPHALPPARRTISTTDGDLGLQR